MQISNAVLNTLSNAQTNGNTLKIVAQLDRALYTQTNKVLEAAGGKWNRKAGAHIFDGDAANAMDQIILTGQIPTLKTKNQLYNYFPTPLALAEKAIAKACIQPGMTVLEPSAGQGALAFLAADRGAMVDCYELMESNFAILVVSNRLRGLVLGDFLTVAPEPVYDRVVMNPPFEKQADIRHVMHAFGFLKAGGILVAIMPAGVTFRDNRLTADFREFVASHSGSIEANPEGSFKESGTMVNTVIVTIRG